MERKLVSCNENQQEVLKQRQFFTLIVTAFSPEQPPEINKKYRHL